MGSSRISTGAFVATACERSSFRFMPWLSARRNVELALRLRGVGRAQRRADLPVGWDTQRSKQGSSPLDIGFRVVSDGELQQFTGTHSVVQGCFGRSVADPTTHIEGAGDGVDPIDEQLSRTWPDDTDERLQECRLSCAVGADESVDRAGVDVQSHSSEHLDVAV